MKTKEELEVIAHEAKVRKASQLWCELGSMLTLVNDLRPKVVVEIGTQRGGSLYGWQQVMEEDGCLITIDLIPKPDKPCAFPSEYFQNVSQEFHELRSRDSHAMETLEELKGILEGREIDFLYLDGDHKYEGVKLDWDMYSPLVRSGGIVALHDVSYRGRPKFGVTRFYTELIKEFTDHAEFTKDNKPFTEKNKRGTGVIFMP